MKKIPKTNPLPYKKHPAADFYAATRGERARSMARMDELAPMITVRRSELAALYRAAMIQRCKILPFRRPGSAG
ncbi:hypothetical protein ES705_09421 [subsurface metagenome]